MPLDDPPDAVSFDCYGTLIDWETGLERDLLFILREKPDAPSAERVAARWAVHEQDLTSGKEGYRRYRDVIAEALRRAFEDLDVAWRPRDGFRLAEGMGRWEPFSDAPWALEELRGLGYKLAFFSNTDDDILAESVKRLGIAPDLAVTAEQVKSYKPDPTIFRVGLQRLGLAPERVLHVSFSPYHDLETAKKLGLRTFWVDRKNLGELEIPHDFRGRDLRELAMLLGP